MTQIGVLGCGNMAEAILASALQAGVYPADQVLVCNKTPSKNQRLAQTYGVQTTTQAQDLAKLPVVVLGIKPQGLSDLSYTPDIDQLIISLLAGTTTTSLEAKLGTTRIARLMPNLGQFVGVGMTGAYYSEICTESDRNLTKILCESGGNLIEVSAESDIDAITAVSGSGVAYFFRWCEAMAESGQNLGLSPDDAQMLVRQTLIGAAEILRQYPDMSPAQWRQRVTSPGGTTQTALDQMETEDISGVIDRAMHAAQARAQEL